MLCFEGFLSTIANADVGQGHKVAILDSYKYQQSQHLHNLKIRIIPAKSGVSGNGHCTLYAGTKVASWITKIKFWPNF